MQVDVSLDKVSLIGDADESLFDRFKLSEASAGFFAGGISLSWDRGGAHVSAKVSTAHGERFLKSEDGSLVFCRGGLRPEVQEARVEFNPNRVTPDGIACVEVLTRGTRCTRVDAALDYPGVCLGDYAWSRPRVKTNAWFGSDGVSETVSLGRWSSSRFVRIYDKARELGVADMVLTRVESVQRVRPDHDALPDDLFDGVRCYRKSVPSGLSAYDAGLVALSLHEPGALREIAKAQGNGSRLMKRVAGLVHDSCGELQPSPAAVYRSNLSDLRDMLSDVSRGLMVRRAAVYS